MDKKELIDLLYQRAVRKIAARPRSEREMHDFLTKKLSRFHLSESDSLEIAQTLIQNLKEENLINDSEFVAWWAEQRAYFKPKGVRVLKAELLQKGITKDQTDSYFENNPIEEEKTASMLLQKRKKMYQSFSKPEKYRKSISFLLRRGFSYEASKKAFEETFEIE